MITYKQLMESLNEQVRFNNWVFPKKKDLELEYKVEYEIKPLKQMTNNAFPDFQHFEKAVSEGKVVEVDKSLDRKIEYRSHTSNKEELLNLIRGYASYPKFRNEDTIQAIYDGFEDNSPMKMPLVLRFPRSGKLRIMGGNTRMDIARHLGINPKVIVVDVPES